MVDFFGWENGNSLKRRILCETLTKISDQLRGPLAPLRGPTDSKKAHWAFSEKNLWRQTETFFQKVMRPTVQCTACTVYSVH